MQPQTQKRTHSEAFDSNDNDNKPQFNRYNYQDLSIRFDNDLFHYPDGNQQNYASAQNSDTDDVRSVVDNTVDDYDPDFQDDTNALQADFSEFEDMQYGGTDKKSPAILESLASKINQACVNKPNMEKLNKILDKFAPPENCVNLAVPKVNEELWLDLNRFHRSNDLAVQTIQKYLLGGMSAVAMALNEVVKCRTNNEPLDLQKANENLYYAVTLLGYSSYELSMRRRISLRPKVNSAYRNVCRPSRPLTTFLFGDNLPQALDEIGKGNRIRNKFSNHGGRGGFSSGGFSSGGRGGANLDRRRSTPSSRLVYNHQRGGFARGFGRSFGFNNRNYNDFQNIRRPGNAGNQGHGQSKNFLNNVNNTQNPK